jgi:hypothetical protein
LGNSIDIEQVSQKCGTNGYEQKCCPGIGGPALKLDGE